MTQDEVIEMAIQAGFVEYELDDGTTNAFDKRYETFAKLVDAKAKAKEREEIIAITETQEFSRMYGEFTPSAYDLVKAIRARGEA